ncbi:MAG: Co2+/Mg2+ efflux protein ApaG [Phycisphaerales bacterium]|jgi:ApaG protein|nr:Co2+/Mg2+ efflux protein ApaG [Phycisphaerales bacterium]
MSSRNAPNPNSPRPDSPDHSRSEHDQDHAPQGDAHAAPGHATSIAPHRGSVATTRGICITCAPRYEREMSDPAKPQHVFTYSIRIENTSRETVQLRTRHWVIVDAHGKREEVHGEGVVGTTPTLEPGRHFQYESWCPLASRWGTMEGHYGFVTSEGDPFDAEIARFYLVAED